MDKLTCTLTTCRDAQDFVELCGDCQVEFGKWVDGIVSPLDADDIGLEVWVAEQERLGLDNNEAPPDFDPTYFDVWTLPKVNEESILYGRHTDPPQCTECRRVASDNDPEIRYNEFGEVISCGACVDTERMRRERKADKERQRELSKKRKKTTMIAARRYCSLFADASIIGMSIDKPARLMRKHPAGHFVFVAEIIGG